MLTVTEVLLPFVAAAVVYSVAKNRNRLRNQVRGIVFPHPPKTNAFGVQIHPSATPDDMWLVRRTMPKFCRCDMGEDIPPAQTKMIYDALLTAGITPIFITSRVQDTSASGIAKYVVYHRDLAALYPNAWWEICNETNIPYFWGNKNPDPVAYAGLVKLLTPMMRRSIAPTSKIISAGTSGIDLNYIKAYLAAGVEGLVDFVGFHPYGIPPYSLNLYLNELRGITKTPLFCTEYGVAGDDGTALSRMAKACGDEGVPFVWYQLKDGVPNAIDANNTFGLFTADGQSKPGLQAAIAYSTTVA